MKPKVTKIRARKELDRRAHNKTVKRSGRGKRIEATDEYARALGRVELKKIAGMIRR